MHDKCARGGDGGGCRNGIVKRGIIRIFDGLITNRKGHVLSTFYADCVPLYFVDPVHRAIGMSHSGWKGTVGKLGAATITAMKRESGTETKDLVCAIGPSICQDCYEVSEDVADAFKEAFPGHADEILLDKKNGKYQLDLWRANEIVLTEAGVLKEKIAVTNICTCCNPDLLFSHRASMENAEILGVRYLRTQYNERKQSLEYKSKEEKKKWKRKIILIISWKRQKRSLRSTVRPATPKRWQSMS
ncbi:MAG: polyphenol oxidase family protein [Roseburia intestinalis]